MSMITNLLNLCPKNLLNISTKTNIYIKINYTIYINITQNFTEGHTHQRDGIRTYTMFLKGKIQSETILKLIYKFNVIPSKIKIVITIICNKIS